MVETAGQGVNRKDEEEEIQSKFPSQSLSIVEEQEQLKRALKMVGESNANGDGDDDDNFFVERKKSSKEREKEEIEFADFKLEQAALSDAKKKSGDGAAEPSDELSLLRAFWKAENLDKNEKFLRKYKLFFPPRKKKDNFFQQKLKKWIRCSHVKKY